MATRRHRLLEPNSNPNTITTLSPLTITISYDPEKLRKNDKRQIHLFFIRVS